jgi:hypothetical protein
MTTVTLTSSEQRHAKAILIAADSGQWLRPDRLIDGRRPVGIPSQTKRGLYHWTDGVTCSCYDFRRRQLACKHVTAYRLEAIARASEPQPQPASDTVDGLRQVLEQRLAEHEPAATSVAEGDSADSNPLTREAHPEDRRLADRYADIFSNFEGTDR